MANRTVKDANSIHGTNPQYLVEKIIRTRIYESKYWKEECFGLTDIHFAAVNRDLKPLISSPGGADLQRDEARRPGETAIAARAPGAIAAAPETDATAPNPQVTTGATDTAATPSPLRGVQRRVTRRVEEETSDLPFPFIPFPPFFVPSILQMWFLLQVIWVLEVVPLTCL
ncbi:pre-mRNA-splicing factor 38A [Etheostoma cragini]|uniref:pre-mRNA-splicing factor 38A n=1 Tax=Etheostoma cragini TaxID=417921 RepID=UPI00155E13D1|nr:pre-mRNA-splicing factor 38A [Etheostoma cragini]